MKILIVVEKETSAIARLARMTKSYSNENIEIIAIHPKRESEENIQKFKVLAEHADLIDFEYWKTATMLLNRFPELKSKPSILSHHNPYDVLAEDWREYEFNCIVAKNKSQYKELEDAGYKNIAYIRHAVDFADYDYIDDRKWDGKDVLMVCARIEGKKGVREVAQACKELGYNFHLVGSISNADYFNEVLALGINFYQNISDEKLRELYGKCTIHVCNSIDKFESGTLPILESMATGLPVLTRNVGLVPDIYNEKNMVLRDGQPEDIGELKALIKDLVLDVDRRKQMSVDAYRSVIYYSAELMAREYSRLFRKVYFGEKSKVVSVIVPTIPERRENARKIFEYYENQSYKNVEVVFVNDDTEDAYPLARNRNLGAIFAIGDILLFNDDRLLPEGEAVQEFVSKMAHKTWLFGNKDGAEKESFVENFSAVYRDDFMACGMMNCMMDEYGGMSQELRERLKKQGYTMKLIKEAKASTLHKSSNQNTKLKSIRRMKTRLSKMGF